MMQGYERFDAMERCLTKFRRFATEKNVHLSLVIHPRKEPEDMRLAMSSVFGTAKATQEADNVIILQTGEDGKYIDVKKNRFDGTLGTVGLRFDDASQRFLQKQLPKEPVPMPPVVVDILSPTKPPSKSSSPLPSSSVVFHPRAKPKAAYAAASPYSTSQGSGEAAAGSGKPSVAATAPASQLGHVDWLSQFQQQLTSPGQRTTATPSVTTVRSSASASSSTTAAASSSSPSWASQHLAALDSDLDHNFNAAPARASASYSPRPTSWAPKRHSPSIATSIIVDHDDHDDEDVVVMDEMHDDGDEDVVIASWTPDHGSFPRAAGGPGPSTVKQQSPSASAGGGAMKDAWVAPSAWPEEDIVFE